MSDTTNSELYQEAYEMLEAYTGTTIAKVIQHDLDIGDLEALYNHVNVAGAMLSQEEFANNDAL